MGRPLFVALAGLVAVAGCRQGEVLETGADRGSNSAGRAEAPLRVSLYDRVEPRAGQPVPTFNMAAAEGSLGSKDGCLVLESGGRTMALVFARGSAKPEGPGRLLVDGRSFAIGDRVRLGGSSTGGSAVGAAEIAPGCGQSERWLVAPGSVEPAAG
ncbi:MAG TPA: hypothetical protein VFQ67_15795 [Allosphingosinicella sp.]|jgi:hypothetical protein|nr:hypothetical protein [Allosphingosinicella sp.]